MPAKDENSDKDKCLELFLKIGLDERTARNTIANNKVTANLSAVINEVFYIGLKIHLWWSLQLNIHLRSPLRSSNFFFYEDGDDVASFVVFRLVLLMDAVEL